MSTPLTFKCPLCQRVSYNPLDVKHEWCGVCGGPEGREQLFIQQENLKFLAKHIDAEVFITPDTHEPLYAMHWIFKARMTQSEFCEKHKDAHEFVVSEMTKKVLYAVYWNKTSRAYHREEFKQMLDLAARIREAKGGKSEF